MNIIFIFVTKFLYILIVICDNIYNLIFIFSIQNYI